MEVVFLLWGTISNYTPQRRRLKPFEVHPGVRQAFLRFLGPAALRMASAGAFGYLAMGRVFVRIAISVCRRPKILQLLPLLHLKNIWSPLKIAGGGKVDFCCIFINTFLQKFVENIKISKTFSITFLFFLFPQEILNICFCAAFGGAIFKKVASYRWATAAGRWTLPPSAAGLLGRIGTSGSNLWGGSSAIFCCIGLARS